MPEDRDGDLAEGSGTSFEPMFAVNPFGALAR